MEKDEKREQLKGSLFITTKEIQILNGCCLRNAQREHLAIRDILEIKGKKVSVKAYCDFWKLDINEVIIQLNKYR